MFADCSCSEQHVHATQQLKRMFLKLNFLVNLHFDDAKKCFGHLGLGEHAGIDIYGYRQRCSITSCCGLQ